MQRGELAEARAIVSGLREGPVRCTKKSTKSVATNAILGPALTTRKSNVLDKKSRAIF